MSKHLVMGLFQDFDQAFEVIAGIRRFEVPGVNVDDVTLRSPIEHPEIEDVLGERPAHVAKWGFAGGLFGLVGGFLFLAAAQATFLVQPQGGKPVITIPSNLVLAYEMLILFAMLAMVAGFILGARLMRRRGRLYHAAVSLDQIAILVEVDSRRRDSLKTLFEKHRVLQIDEEALP